jgi:ribonuclease R
LQRSSPRFAFVVTDGEEGDVYVASRHLAGALDGDEVEMQVRRNRRSGLLQGRVVRILNRPPRELTGKVSGTRGGCVLLPDDPRFPGPILIAEEKASSFTDGDRVVAELSSKRRGELNSCRVTEILGDADDARLDSTIIAREFGIVASFGAKAEEEAEAAFQSDEDGRTDFGDLRIFTIDPEAAADFDDALSIQRLPGDHLQLGVHIADVSSFVKEGSALDAEAAGRGNSVYLPDRVFPMLPEKVSNDLCSLAPELPKRCISVLMELTKDADLVRSKIVESTIVSARRFTYQEVQGVLDGRLECPGGLERDIRLLSALVDALKVKRKERKSLDLELPELKVRLSDLGFPEELCVEEKTASHSLVEEAMILANAEIGSSIKARGIPFVFRVHPRAKKEKITEFMRAATALGIRNPGRPGGDFRQLAGRLGGSLNPERRRLLSSLFVRSMEKARYDVSDIGHYGLALDGYCHFTSPIRRYADLVNHRIVRRCLVGRAKGLPRGLVSKLPAIAETCSEMEVVADEAEREANRLKALRFMERYLGDVFEGIIVGVVNSGFFVEISGHMVEGMVSRDVLRDDSYYPDEEHFALIGRRRGKKYSLGQSLRVQIAKVDPLARAMDLVPAQEEEPLGQKSRKNERRWR